MRSPTSLRPGALEVQWTSPGRQNGHRLGPGALGIPRPLYQLPHGQSRLQPEDPKGPQPADVFSLKPIQLHIFPLKHLFSCRFRALVTWSHWKTQKG